MLAAFVKDRKIEFKFKQFDYQVLSIMQGFIRDLQPDQLEIKKFQDFTYTVNFLYKGQLNSIGEFDGYGIKKWNNGDIY